LSQQALLFKFQFQTQLLDSKTMLHALRVNFENFGYTTKNTIFRLVKLLADLSTRLNAGWFPAKIWLIQNDFAKSGRHDFSSWHCLKHTNKICIKVLMSTTIIRNIHK